MARSRRHLLMKLWQKATYGNDEVEVLNLDHPRVENRVIDDIERGTDVYYDRRWEVTDLFAKWLADNTKLFQGKTILVLGAGVGEETIVLGKYAKHILLNDLSEIALELCSEQLDRNDISAYTVYHGTYESLDFPEIDLIVASFLIYNKETLRSMTSFINERQASAVLMNESLPDFKRFLSQQDHELLFENDGAVCLQLNSLE